ncbi:MAG: DUF3035 domain-containing protein [Silicimonas sp.]|nr:DUF3035 domain-containing protein [Silicimonas sp.]
MVALTACGGGDAEPNLLNIKQPRTDGPDEFSVLPSKPIEIPQDLAALPPPTPGGTNRTDPTPEADVAVALGGNPAVLSRRGTDGALRAHTGRFGVDPQIREELAAADLEFRRQNDGRLLERIFNVNVYFQAYEPFELDQYRELERLRRAGIRTSGVPPEDTGEE